MVAIVFWHVAMIHICLFCRRKLFPFRRRRKRTDFAYSNFVIMSDHIEVLRSSRGGEILVVNDYLYHRNKKVSSNAVLIYLNLTLFCITRLMIPTTGNAPEENTTSYKRASVLPDW